MTALRLRRPTNHVILFGLVVLGCAVGRGDGFVSSEDLFAGDCLAGPFELEPSFYSTNPYENTQLIRLQNGDKQQETADGLMISVLDVAAIRGKNGQGGMLGTPIEVRLPAGLTPVGVIPDYESPLVSMTLYLNDTCRGRHEAVSLQAISGTITFASLFSGRLNEGKKSEKLIEASFDVIVGDPRASAEQSESQNRLVGNFRFYFRRGQSAQPFP